MIQLATNHQEIINKGVEAISSQAVDDMYRWRNTFGRPGYVPPYAEAVTKIIEYNLKVAGWMDNDKIGLLYHIAAGGNGYKMDDTIGIRGYLYEDDPWRKPGDYKVRASGYMMLYSVLEGLPNAD